MYVLISQIIASIILRNNSKSYYYVKWLSDELYQEETLHEKEENS